MNPSGKAGRLSGALVALIDGKLEYLDFAALQDPKTGKTRVRGVEIDSPSYKVAREYMIRLEKEDFSDEDKLRLLAEAASSTTRPCSTDEFRDRYQHLTADLKGCI